MDTFTLKSKSYPMFVASISVAVSPSVTLYEAGSKKTVRSRKSGIIIKIKTNKDVCCYKYTITL